MPPSNPHATAPRLFVPDALRTGAEIVPSAAQAHHLGTVLRARPGAAVRLFNGRDGEVLAHIITLKRDQARLLVAEQLRPQAVEGDLWLAFAPLKRDMTDLVAQKATELGAAAILPVFTARTNAGRVNTDRLRAIAVEASEQCERLTVPRVGEPVRLADLLAAWPAGRPLFAAIERADAPPPPAQFAAAALLVGPEGGFAPDELELLRRHADVRAVSLGPRVLRAETACIVGLALLQTPIGG